MPEKSATPEAKPETATPEGAAPASPPVPPKRSPGHRGADVKDTVAEMTAKAHEISLEAGSKMAAAMKDVVNAAAGITGFVLESARDLVQYMVRRGQMTQEEADKLIRQAEEAQGDRPATPPAPAASAKAAAPAAPKTAAASAQAPASVAASAPSVSTHPAAESAPAKPAATAKTAAPSKPAAKTAKPAAKAAAKPAPKAPAKKSAARTAAKAPVKKPAAKPAPKKGTAKRK